MSSVRVSHRKERVGVVLSQRMSKTVVVRLSRLARHSLYGKVRRFASKVKVHDEKGVAKVGDKVRIIATRPFSKEKRWLLKEVVGPS